MNLFVFVICTALLVGVEEVKVPQSNHEYCENGSHTH
jgi:hypothetical protein